MADNPSAERLRVQTPICFPLPEVPLRDRAYLEKAWATADLERYLVRWRHSRVPMVPEAFFSFKWRACDVGCGMGRYIIQQSALNPEHAYLGIDKGTRRATILQSRAERIQRPNLFALHANVTPVLAQLPKACLDAIFIFYPNPWWPPKHRKKRWPYHPLLPRLFDLLKSDGRLMLCSNEAFYLSEWVFALTHHPRARQINIIHSGPVSRDLGRTHFEEKFRQAGVVCGEVIAEKTSVTAGDGHRSAH